MSLVEHCTAAEWPRRKAAKGHGLGIDNEKRDNVNQTTSNAKKIHKSLEVTHKLDVIVLIGNLPEEDNVSELMLFRYWLMTRPRDSHKDEVDEGGDGLGHSPGPGAAVKITICILLHPSDILELRKTCKALELATRKRIVWVAVLHRVCIDNILFSPSFPIPDMSDLELERAAMAPRRWIELCSALQKQHSNDISKTPVLHPRTRIIKHADNSQFFHCFIVPGGRYLVTAGKGLYVWDLGYVSSTVDCKLVASVEAGEGDDFSLFKVQASPDGKGLVILSTLNFLSQSSDHFSIYEIYPQSELPLLIQIAHLDWFPSEVPAHLLPDTLICCADQYYSAHEHRIVFRVVDYRTNHSTCFSVSVGDYHKTFATKTAIIVFCNEAILIWAIPPLSPQPSDLPDHHATHIPPLFKIPFTDSIIRHPHEINRFLTASSWYCGSQESIYFDILYTDLKLQRFKIIIKPDLSDASLHVINISDIISDWESPVDGYRICEDALVYIWRNRSARWWNNGLR